jgi:DNA-binding SARP family transcriptional activator/tetratricopeptide (TPR) repeat protein
MIRLRTLGACAIQVGETTIGPEAERLFAVLLYLTTERGRRTPRRTIQDLLWPDASEEHGRHNLRQAIYKLRQYGVELGGGARDVQLHPDQIAFDPFDVLSGDAAVAGDALLRGEVGEYLAGYAPAFSEPYAAWVEAQRAYCHARVARVAVAATLERRARGRWEEVERLATVCLRYDPLNEEATLALAEATAMAGSKARALAILDQYLVELGDSTSIQLPATLLRRRIAERLPEPAYTVPSEACFAGRDESLRYLHELFGQGRAGRGQACMVVGEPGVGKSRLASEFARVAMLQGALTFRMGSQPRDAARPLSLFVDGVQPRRIIEFDADAEAPTHDGRDSEYLYANVRRSVLDLLDAIVAERTLLLVIEDVHWSDPASWDVLRDVIAWCAGRRVLVVLTARIAHVPGSPLEQLPLRLHHIGPLAADAATQLLDALVAERQRQLSEQQRGWLLRSASGNPLFLRELAIHWLETGREAEVPPSLAALLRERLARLGPLALRVFQTCAVMGVHATFERLETVLEYRRHAVLDALQELEAAGLLRAGGAGVHCRHELVSEAAVSALGESARTFLHRQVALVLEPAVLASVPSDASLLWACAGHWEAAGEAPRAWKIANACGGYLLEVGRPAEAIDVYERAQSFAQTDADRRRCRGRLVEALIHGGRYETAMPLLRELVSADCGARNRGSDAWTARLQLVEGECWTRGDLHNAVTTCKELAASRSVPPVFRVRFAIIGMTAADALCSPSDVAALWSSIESELSHSGVAAHDRAMAEMIFHTTVGSLDEAWRATGVMLTESRQLETPAKLAQALRRCAHVANRCGEIHAGLKYLKAAVEVAESNHLVAHAIQGCGFVAERLAHDYDIAGAQAWYDRAAAWLAIAGNPSANSNSRWTLAKLALFRHRPSDAASVLHESLGEMMQIVDLRQRLECMALHVHLHVEQRTVVPAQLSAAIESTFDALKGVGGVDYAAFVTFMQAAQTSPQVAADRLSAYVTSYRRERGVLPQMLRTSLDRGQAALTEHDG